MRGLQAGRDIKIKVVGALPAAAPRDALHQLRAPPGDFTGRKAELDDLRKHMGKAGAVISALQGQGGVGKTALALRLAAELAPRYPDAQIDLDLQGAGLGKPLSPGEVMAHVLRAFEPLAKLPESERDLGALYRAALHGKHALLFFDNAKDRAQVEPLLPPEGCVLLLTSRSHFVLPDIYAKDLDTLPPGDAVALVRRIVGRVDAASAGTIAKLCGYLPFALRLAASKLAERRDLDPAEYVERLRTAKERFGLIDGTIGLSFDGLTPERRTFWCRLGVFPGSFDREAAAAVGEVGSWSAAETLSDLLRESLLGWDEEAKRYRLHDLARVYALEKLGEEECAAAERRHAVHFVGIAGTADALYKKGSASVAAGLGLFDREWQNIAAGQAWAAGRAENDDAAARLTSDYPDAGVYCLALRLSPRERVGWLEAAVRAAQRVGDREVEGAHLGSLGVAYADLGEPHRAVELHEQRLNIAREIGDRSGEGNALGNLGLAYVDLGEPRHAIELYEQVLAIFREIGDRRGEGNTLGNLGSAYANLGEPRRAIELYEQQLLIVREIGDRRGEGNALGGLGNVYAVLDEPRRAVELYEQWFNVAREIGDRQGEANAN
jgi:tetratricopeptide (TPR) repeat protein